MSSEVREIIVTPATLTSLTVGEIEEIENRTGAPIGRAFDEDRPKGVVLRALAYIVLRRESESATWEDAGSCRVTMGEDVVATTGHPTRGRGSRRQPAG
jgi:hypothetical protein